MSPLNLLSCSVVDGQKSVYFVRVLETPRPRWTTYDAVEIGLAPSDIVPAFIQESSWTSPVWCESDPMAKSK